MRLGSRSQRPPWALRISHFYDFAAVQTAIEPVACLIPSRMYFWCACARHTASSEFPLCVGIAVDKAKGADVLHSRTFDAKMASTGPRVGAELYDGRRPADHYSCSNIEMVHDGIAVAGSDFTRLVRKRIAIHSVNHRWCNPIDGSPSLPVNIVARAPIRTNRLFSPQADIPNTR